jgi:hypothetical protein
MDYAEAKPVTTSACDFDAKVLTCEIAAPSPLTFTP